jgi:hypothetical protein
MASRLTETDIGSMLPTGSESDAQTNAFNDPLQTGDMDATGMTASQGMGGLGGSAVGGTDPASSTPVTAMPGGEVPQGAFGSSVNTDTSGTEAGTGGLRGMGGVYSTSASRPSQGGQFQTTSQSQDSREGDFHAVPQSETQAEALPESEAQQDFSALADNQGGTDRSSQQ